MELELKAERQFYGKTLIAGALAEFFASLPEDAVPYITVWNNQMDGYGVKVVATWKERR